MIPKFNKRGYLPSGIHKATWEEFSLRFGTNEKRKRLIIGLRSALDNLKQAGCRRIYIDGSFVSAEENPRDWDGCWEKEGVDNSKLDSLIADEKFHHIQRKEKYLGDFFALLPRLPGHGWVDFFQRDRDGNRKGIIVIEMKTLL